MFDRPHHRRIGRILDALDPEAMRRTDCAFAGGTLISMRLGEFRRSDDVDLICMSGAGYAQLRTLLQKDRSGLFRTRVTFLRELRIDPYRAFSFLEVDGAPIKFEIFSERRVDVAAELDPMFGIPCLTRESLFTEKLLACSDRGLDPGTLGRDAIDLAMMERAWGGFPKASLDMAVNAYGPTVVPGFRKAAELILDRRNLEKFCEGLDISPKLAGDIVRSLERLALSIGDRTEFEEVGEAGSRDRLADGGVADPFRIDCPEMEAIRRAVAEQMDQGERCWPQAERRAMEIAVADLSVEPHRMAQFLGKHSPGAVYPERVRMLDRLAIELQEKLDALRAPPPGKP